MNIISKLQNFDIDNLDMFELMQYNDFKRSITKEESLQILINNVEGDFTQLSDELSEIAQEQENEYLTQK
jgi:hypothetical protein